MFKLTAVGLLKAEKLKPFLNWHLDLQLFVKQVYNSIKGFSQLSG